MKNNLASIITPSFKSEKFISKTIESVLDQTYQNWEMIIVDDISPDKSNIIIEEYMIKDSRIKLIRLDKNSGPAVARNRARRLLRESIRRLYSVITPGWDIILVARTNILGVQESEVEDALCRTLHRAGLTHSNQD